MWRNRLLCFLINKSSTINATKNKILNFRKHVVKEKNDTVVSFQYRFCLDGNLCEQDEWPHLAAYLVKPSYRLLGGYHYLVIVISDKMGLNFLTLALSTLEDAACAPFLTKFRTLERTGSVSVLREISARLI